LGFTRQAINGSQLFIDALIQKHLISDIFSFYLRPSGEQGSVLLLGGSDERYHSPNPISYFPVVQPEGDHHVHWMLNLSSVSVRQRTSATTSVTLLNFCDQHFRVERCVAIFDSGTSTIEGPSKMVDEIIRVLNVDPQCSNYYQLPNIIFSFGKKSFVLEPIHYILQIPLSSMSGFVCVLAITPRSAKNAEKEQLWTLGTPFFSQTFYRF